MKFFEVMAKAVNKIWNFTSTMLMICSISAFALFGIAMFMPDNAVKVIEMIKGLLL